MMSSGCGCLACRAPDLFTRNGQPWRVCPPCYDHLAEHFENEPGDNPWNVGVGLTHNKEECLLEGKGCVTCGQGHMSIRERSTLENLMTEEDMREIST